MTEDKKEKQFIKMTQTPMVKLILMLSAPTVVSMMITSIYNMADTYFVSQLGTSASGAVGVVMPLMAIIQAFGFMLGSGAGSRISIYLGEGNSKEAEKVASSAVFASILCGLFIALVSWLILPDLLRLMGATETILPYALSYSKYILFGFPIMCSSFVLNHLLRS
ncbi:MAG: MATE family efflux transporter [Ruminiclostridium sp.]|nr:MATE family efflux transporter [Ruminiclostridium sp.]